MPPSRTAASGSIRVAPAPQAQTDATTVTSVPVSIATTAVRVWKTIAACGISRSTALNSTVRPFASATPRPRPIAEAITPSTAPSSTTERRIWRRDAPSAGSRLLRPLGDRDRERVEDDEGADEEGDAAEGEQEIADERDELAHALAVLVRLLRAGLDLGGRGRTPSMAARSSSDPTPSRAPTAMASKPNFVEHLPRRRDVEQRDRGAAEAVDVAETGDPGQLEGARRPSPAIWTLSPILNPWSSAVFRSIDLVRAGADRPRPA